eukprot:SAG31_NODE_11204_length_1054_cov_1.208377_1_plen_100_part_00
MYSDTRQDCLAHRTHGSHPPAPHGTLDNLANGVAAAPCPKTQHRPARSSLVARIRGCRVQTGQPDADYNCTCVATNRCVWPQNTRHGCCLRRNGLRLGA